MSLSTIFKRILKSEIQSKMGISRTGRPRKLSIDEAINCIFLLVRTGMQWRELRPENASYVTVSNTMHTWLRKGIFESAYMKVLQLYRKHHPVKYYCVDSTFIKNVYGTDCIGRSPVDRGRKASKLSVVTDQNGMIHAFHSAKGNVPDVCLLESTLRSMIGNVDSVELFADKGYDSKRNRMVCAAVGLKDRISRKRCKTGKRQNGKRVVVENVFAWLDKYRRLILRYEVHISTYEAFTMFAAGNILCNRFLHL
jgi:transposase